VAVNASVQRELREQDRRDLLWSAATDGPRHFLTLHQMRRDREISSHNPGCLINEHEGARALRSRVMGVALQPFGEGSVAAIERFQVMVELQRLETVGHWMR
jgi:hypothetical protein